MTMTTTDIDAEYVVDRLSDPYSDPLYRGEMDKLEVLKLELQEINDKIAASETRASAIEVETSDDVKKVSKLEARIDLLHREAEHQHSLVLRQKAKCQEALTAAKQETAQEATVLWREEVLPEVIAVFERMKELQQVYVKLRQNAGGKMKPDFPVFRFPELWVKKRLQERDDE